MNEQRRTIECVLEEVLGMIWHDIHQNFQENWILCRGCQLEEEIKLYLEEGIK
jgi:hypothetical protein